MLTITPEQRAEYLRTYLADPEHALSVDQDGTRWAEVNVGEVLAVLDDFDRLRRGAKTLGETIEKQCQMILDITGLHDWIDEDGDGDWGAVWENAYSLLPKLRAVEQSQAETAARLATAEAELADMTIRADERRVMCDERDALVTRWHAAFVGSEAVLARERERADRLEAMCDRLAGSRVDREDAAEARHRALVEAIGKLAEPEFCPIPDERGAAGWRFAMEHLRALLADAEGSE